MSDDNKTITGRIIKSAVEIMGEQPPVIEYQHGLFCQIALPRSRPQGREFLREYQNGAIKIQAGDLYNGVKLIPQPIPYGPKARLALIHLNSEAIRTRNPEIYCERSGRKFMERLGLNTDGGKDYNLFKAQMKALAACRMTLGFNRNGKPITRDVKPIHQFDGWLEGEDGEQLTLWPGIITLTREYFEDLLEHAVPLDGRAIRALAHSALALDAYSFLARRLYTLKKPQIVTHEQFHAQFGQEYTGKEAVKNFRKEWLPAMKAAATVYPSARVEQVRGGLRLYPSLPSVHQKAVAVSHGLADQVRGLLPPSGKGGNVP